MIGSSCNDGGDDQAGKDAVKDRSHWIRVCRERGPGGFFQKPEQVGNLANVRVLLGIGHMVSSWKKSSIVPLPSPPLCSTMIRVVMLRCCCFVQPIVCRIVRRQTIYAVGVNSQTWRIAKWATLSFFLVFSHGGETHGDMCVEQKKSVLDARGQPHKSTHTHRMDGLDALFFGIRCF